MPSDKTSVGPPEEILSFDYDKHKQAHNDGFWTSYSDLFLGLSTVFLLLYVTASLRTGTDAIRSQVDNQKLTMQNEELRNQLKMYEDVKTQYLEKEASKSEAQEYQELMDKLTLLKEDSKSEAERLAKQSLEHETKEKALNKYQQLVRNIINANKLAKTKLLARNSIIGEQDSTIDQQKQDIDGLQSAVDQKQMLIKENEQKIAETKRNLEANRKLLKKAFEANEITKREFQQKTHSLESKNANTVKALRENNVAFTKQLKSLSSELNSTQSALTSTKSALQQKSQEATQLQDRISKIKGEFEREQASAKAAFDEELKKGQMNAAEQAKREGEFRAAADQRAKDMQNKIAGLSTQLKSTEGELSKAKEERDARRQIAEEIKKGFAAAGVKADVDMGTGEVVLDFGQTYFDNDSSKLKPQMREVIEKAMPVYSKSLFGNPKVADKISSVEIVGFASPTYKGRYVDPKSSNAQDKRALKYNMDLSYRRANSIFSYMLESKDSESENQKNLLALMKVSGRSFLDVMKVKSRGPANAAEFCKVNDCKKAQRVIVRFSMDGKAQTPAEGLK